VQFTWLLALLKLGKMVASWDWQKMAGEGGIWTDLNAATPNSINETLTILPFLLLNIFLTAL
jgi:hypothetical protein